ncbi:carboxypeptidase B [Erpetoichthys calabaricus]|uniref:Carboxypeptidase B n=1 Tax=Erpetoichthys calabaricus TaxID=27687 RepID=A0A8C4T1C7_ERPCA|nr:carboxypeptidase B [Erpetoichthys calabaricus]
MKALLLLALTVAVSAGPSTSRFDGVKVFRLKPDNEYHVNEIKNLAEKIKLNFWNPEGADQVTSHLNVDVQVNDEDVLLVKDLLQRSGMEYEVLIEDLQKAIERQFDNKHRSTAGYSYEKYNSWEKISEWAESMATENPTLVTKTQIGQTFEGRHMVLLKLGKNTGFAKPAIFMDCGIHAREWISPAFCQWFVKEAVTSYGSDPAMTSLLNNMDVFVLPVFNIDGYVYTWTRDRMWRKTRSKNSGTTCVGTDPNRNFDAGWCTVGASKQPCSETYCGSRVESEIEVKAVADFIRKNRSIIKAYLTIHSYSQLLLFPYSYTTDLAAHHSELLDIARSASNALYSLYGTRYTSGPGAVTIYPAAGGSDDWAYDLGIKYSFTFELRDEGRFGFLLPESQIKPTCEETMLAVKYIATYVQEHNY